MADGGIHVLSFKTWDYRGPLLAWLAILTLVNE